METSSSGNKQQLQTESSWEFPLLIVVFTTLVVIYAIDLFFKSAVTDFLNNFWRLRQPQTSPVGGQPLATNSSAQQINLQSQTIKRASKNPNLYRTLSEVQAAIKRVGLESSNLILAIDFTKSNTWTGAETFNGYSLHDISRKGVENPYQRVMRIIAKTLNSYDEDSLIPAFGFGDIFTKGHSCFPFFPDRPCHGLQEVLDRYVEIVGDIQLSGPTNFAPAINKAIEIVKERGDYNVLVIIADGQVDKTKDTVDAIVAASQLPLSIVCVGVGDGPWDMMEQFDDQIPQRRFDNFQFVNMRALEEAYKSAGEDRLEAEFACAALMELPEQYAAMRRLAIL